MSGRQWDPANLPAGTASVFRQVTEPFAVHSYRYRHHDPNLAGTEANFFASAQAVPQTERLTLNVTSCGGKRCWMLLDRVSFASF
jgi:hypothetical protein